jgi:hypothetical protein
MHQAADLISHLDGGAEAGADLDDAWVHPVISANEAHKVIFQDIAFISSLHFQPLRLLHTIKVCRSSNYFPKCLLVCGGLRHAL